MTTNPPTDTSSGTRVERYDTIVIGGGQAGLAAGYHLAHHDADFLILEAASHVGDSWRRRWDSLRLNTPAKFSSLPGMPFPAREMHLADKHEVVDYLTRYADRFELPVRTNTRVHSLTRDGARYVVETGPVRYEARNVIVATGQCQNPFMPRLATDLAPDIHQIHSSGYRNPFELPEGPVLVVGAGSSGAQIALEVSRFRKVYLAGASTGHLRRRVLGHDVYTWLWPILSRATSHSWFGRRMHQRFSHDPVIGLTEQDLARAGVVRTGRVTDARNGLPVVDGRAMNVRTIIWCTGFAPDYRWIDVPLELDHGRPRTVRGVVRESPGLYFLGLRFLHSMTSALLGGVGVDAAYVVDHIVAGATM